MMINFLGECKDKLISNKIMMAEIFEDIYRYLCKGSYAARGANDHPNN